MLDIKITGVETDRNLNALICGNPGSGKTLLSSTFPNPFYASFEAGLLSVRKRKVPSVEVKAVKTMDEIIRTMRQSPSAREKMIGVPVDTLVVDTLDNFQKLIKRDLLAKSGKPTLTMQEWGQLGELMRSYVAALRGLDMNVVVTCHLKRVVEEDTGRVSFVPLLEGSYRDEVAGEFDIVGILEARTERIVEGKGTKQVAKRFLRTIPDMQSDWLKDRSGVLPGQFPVNLEDDFSRMSEIIFADLDDMDQIQAEIDNLQVRVDEATQVAEEVEEVTPEPVSEEKVVEAKASETVDSEEETVSTDQFDMLARPFSDIEDEATRVAVKKEFVEAFGNPALSPVTRFMEALTWVQERTDKSVLDKPTAEVEEAANEAAPEAEVAREVVPCSKPRCSVKDIDDEDQIELSRMQNGGNALCVKHLREMKNK